MKRRHEMIPSVVMGRQVHMWCFGHFGAPVLIFPSAAGFAHEWDGQGMVEVLAPLIEAGKIKLYCPESNVSQTWTDKGELGARMAAHERYESFITGELVPWIHRDCGGYSLPLATSGSSLGGFYAANFALKFPKIFNYALCMSGRYDMLTFTGGQSSKDVYLNNPIAFVSNLQGAGLDLVKNHTHLTLVCGQGAYEEGCIEETINLGKILVMKNISNTVDIWGTDSKHDWTWWQRQALLHLTNRFG